VRQWWRGGWLGVAAVVLSSVALLLPVGRHRGQARRGSRERPGALAEGRAAAAAQLAQQAAPVLAVAPIVDVDGELPAVVILGRHARPLSWGPPEGCPDPGRCGASPWCEGGPLCRDPAPVNPLGRCVLAPGKIGVYTPGRHAAPVQVSGDQ
jgi:hypothetical protein